MERKIKECEKLLLLIKTIRDNQKKHFHSKPIEVEFDIKLNEYFVKNGIFIEQDASRL